ncbi:MAG TPA: hypothetical protein PLC79_02670 [Phycisphaerae bacterium]|nr:hypothetical protein [Phycisphaerae bacterium]
MPHKKEVYKCSKCGQTFKLAMHLGRHLSAKHGVTPASAARSKKRQPFAAQPALGRGRPGGIAGRLGLHNLTLEQLVETIAAAKKEAARRLAAFQEMMR